MTVLSLIAVIGAMMFAMGHSLSVLVTGRMLIGIGMACNLMGTLKLITLWFTPLRFATLSALVSSLGTVGNLIAATPLVLMVQAVGWRNSFLVITGINLVLTLLFYCRSFSSAQPHPSRHGYLIHPKDRGIGIAEILQRKVHLIETRHRQAFRILIPCWD